MIKLGVSACIIGEKVRFDTGHKRDSFVCDALTDFVEFVPVCPEVAIGLPVPRPTIRLLKRDQLDIRLVETKNAAIDHTEKMQTFSQKKAAQLAKEPLCGYVVCAKSPTCGMERVKVYRENGHADKIGVGLYTSALMSAMPWLPIEENGRLHDPVLKENFVLRLFALDDFYRSTAHDRTRRAIIDFHSRYKLVLMAHDITAYQRLGRFVADIAKYEFDDFYQQYRVEFMQALSHCATRASHTNVLMHLQGYFKHALPKAQKAELTALINAYRAGTMPLLAPLTLIQHHLLQSPDPYIEQQRYLHPYPDALCLRYGL